MQKTCVLWKPVGPEEKKLIEQSGMTEFPPRLPEQPAFYPVVQRRYAERIARDWYLPRNGAGYVAKISIRRDFLDAYPPLKSDGKTEDEYRIPAEDMSAFNEALTGEIEIVAAFSRKGTS